MMNFSKFFKIRWSVSRERETYGESICTVYSGELIGQSSGGGFDLLGAALGKITMELFPDFFSKGVSDKVIEEFCGLYREEDNSVIISGSCGVEAVEHILTDLLGVWVTWEYSRDKEGRPKAKTGVHLEYIENKEEAFRVELKRLLRKYKLITY